MPEVNYYCCCLLIILLLPEPVSIAGGHGCLGLLQEPTVQACILPRSSIWTEAKYMLAQWDFAKTPAQAWSCLDSLKGFRRKTVFFTDVTSHFSQNENISPAACL